MRPQARPALSRALADDDYDGVADPRLHGSYDPVEMARLVACAAGAVRHSAKKRPKMSQVRAAGHFFDQNALRIAQAVAMASCRS